MKAKGAISALILGAAFMATTSKPSSDQREHASDPPFLIEIVGEGLGSNKLDSNKLDCSPAPDDACAMARGAEAAFLSPQMGNAKEYVKYELRDDLGSIAGAVSVAEDLQANPRVLAVIGHSSSDTTRAAAPLYSEAHIPLLVPIATSTTVAYPAVDRSWRRFLPTDEHSDPSQRLRNVYRLIPNDKLGQAPAIAYVARSLLGAAEDHVAVVADLSDNLEYAQPLSEELTKLLPMARRDLIPASYQKGQLDQTKLPDLFDSAKPEVTVVVFVGTAQSANRFLPFLALNRPASVRDVILTDGARDLQVKVDSTFNNLNVFLTFPVNQDFSDSLQGRTDTKLLRKALSPNHEQSYEVYGYDSMLMIGKALRDLCPAGQSSCSISRPSLLIKLHDISFFPGVITEYLFNEGESVHPEYGLYGSAPLKQDVLVHGTPRQNAVKLDGETSKQKNDCSAVLGMLDASGLPTATNTDQLGFRYYCSVGFDMVHQHDLDR
jgi:ABC-type branched-subunit amino acid transport system substrate-binding protein